MSELGTGPGYPLRHLRELIATLSAGVSVNCADRAPTQGEIGVLKTSAVTSGAFDATRAKAVVENDEKARVSTPVRAETVLVCRKNTLEMLGDGCFCGVSEPNVFLPDLLWQLETDPGVADPYWLAAVLGLDEVRYRVRSLASGSTSTMPNIAQDEFRWVRVPTPPVETQRALRAVLQGFDHEVHMLDALITAKTELRKGLVQQLLTGRRRLPGFGKKWPDVVLGEVLTESRETGSSGKLARKITVKLYGLGVVPKTERLVGSENTQYYVRRAGQFIYSKLDFLNGAFGIIPPALDGYESTLDSPAFDVSPMVDARFLVEYMRRPVYYEAAVGLAHGGRKARRVNPAQLLETTVRMPPLDEQRAISDLLALSERELALLRQQLDALKEQKRGLLQQLLTGKRRLLAAEGEAPPRRRAVGKGA